MKKYIFIFILAIVFYSCDDDKDLAILDGGVAPTLSGIDENASFVFSKAERTNTWATLSWNDADYGAPTQVSYVLQLDKSGNNFSNPLEFSAFTDNSITIIVNDINKKMYDAGTYLPLIASDVEVRIKASVTDDLPTLYSNVITVAITPFDAGYPKLYVPGEHQSLVVAEQWDPATAPVIYSVEETADYSGYVYFGNAGDEFKVTPQPSMDNAWGAGTSEGTLSTTGGNLSITAAGMHWIEVNTTDETISTELRNWGLIGNATPGGWDTDTDMEYDYVSGKLKVTVDLTAEFIKFRVNDGWDINLGDTDADGTMEPGGDDIAVAEAGNYTVYLDLSTPDFSYELVKN